MWEKHTLIHNTVRYTRSSSKQNYSIDHFSIVPKMGTASILCTQIFRRQTHRQVVVQALSHPYASLWPQKLTSKRMAPPPILLHLARQHKPRYNSQYWHENWGYYAHSGGVFDGSFNVGHWQGVVAALFMLYWICKKHNLAHVSVILFNNNKKALRAIFSKS